MAMPPPRSKLYQAQRKRLRWKRRLARTLKLGQGLLIVATCVGLVWAAYTAYTLLLQAEYFRIRHVDISGTTALKSQDIHYLLGIPAGATLLQLDLPRIGNRLERHPYVKSVALQRKFPDTFTVAIQERVPHLIVVAGGQRLLVDEYGMVLRAVDADEDLKLVHVTLPQQRALLPGMQLRQPAWQRALELLQAFHASPLVDTMRVASLTVQASGASVWRMDPYTFNIHLGEGRIDTQLGRLPLILRYITQQGLTVRAIDLSYRRRAIVTPAS